MQTAATSTFFTFFLPFNMSVGSWIFTGHNFCILGQGNLTETSIDVINIEDKRLINNMYHGKRTNRNQRIKHHINYTLAELLTMIKNIDRHQVLCKL